ncbi:ABC transporter substrate-binding protein [Bacillus sp. AGMB 02131]|uniref:ABC transporter substrate-binding protein n=1 Tax=Peribacillus faecalis TaxID=2772559 RepID=A0A927CY85_9BACI|nr:ABC transporter substrate-binding protein [Peribacillus faecalis]MBD3107880.1 ABC transporter substrate-binding protein [Peribacillus faecalis]
MKKHWGFAAAALLTFALTGCGSTKETEKADVKEQTASETETKNETQTISYLGVDYTVPGEVNNIVAASLEAMEDAAMLGIKPVGALAIAGALPEYLAKDLEGAALIGDKKEPNAEAILALNPDVIVGTSKWDEVTMEKLNKIQTTIPYSHISTNWKDNLIALGQLADKEVDAEKIIADYEAKVAESQVKAAEQLKDKTILIIRVRGGLMNIYPAGVYLNPVLYEDLGAPVPDVVAKAEAQAELSLEALAEVNPDAIFLQFETSENADAPKALEELQNNAIFQSLNAVKNNQVFINAIDPLAQGGTAWSKVKFLDAAAEQLLK